VPTMKTMGITDADDALSLMQKARVQMARTVGRKQR